ncbi:MAG: hypothetical protein LC769_04345, partial [Chloroflexi bacterium]|nr:hypothetical protein [Chloroflexota bacterium]
AISAGGAHTCAILDTGGVRCWGENLYGQLGYGNTTNLGDNNATPDTAGPVRLGSGRTAIAISAGDADTCAVLDDGSVRCWGFGANGRLGYPTLDDLGNQPNIGATPTTTPDRTGPVNLGPGRTATTISAGMQHTCARLDDRSVRCWGSGTNGRLGYCSPKSIGDDETPGTAGPLDLGEPGVGGAPCPSAGGSSSATPAQPSATGAAPTANKIPVVGSDAARARGLRGCLAGVARHARRERRRARHGSPRRRTNATRHLRRHATSGRRRCLRRYGRTPGRITGLRARALSETQIDLSFNAPGTDGSHPPAARSYLIKQSLRPIRSARAFARAQTLCGGSCRFAPSRVGGHVSLSITDLHPHTTYYYAVVARDNVSARRGPRSQTTKATTR